MDVAEWLVLLALVLVIASAGVSLFRQFVPREPAQVCVTLTDQRDYATVGECDRPGRDR